VISFELSEEQQIVRSTIAEFGKSVVRPQSRRLDTDSRIDDGVLAALWSTEVIQAQAEAVDDDSATRSPVTNAIILEELGAADAAVAMAMASTMGFVQAIADQGSAEQRTSLLGRFTGDRFQPAAVAMMEPRFGFDVSRFSTGAKRAGADYIVRGTKTMVPLASRCSHFLVVAATDGAADAFIVPSDAAGVKIAEPKGALGLRALEMAEVAFEDVTVPASMRLGEGNGADIQRIIDSARVGISSILAGLSRGVMEYVIPYTKERVVHGVPLAQKQTIAFNIADMHIDVEAMRWLNWRAAWALETRRPATRTAQLAYTYAGQQAMRIADDGVQAFGGHGFVKAHPLELWYRNARTLSVLEGAAGV
jgi:alkylation response protein AidB-like acyl-CoA dehydrogenase